jgi:uncharacterized protein YegL
MEARATNVAKDLNMNREFILCGDISGSMAERDSRCAGETRYDYMLEKFKLFISEASKVDQHGEIDVILFGEKVHVYPEVKLEEISQKLSRVKAEGATMTDLALEAAYQRHIEKKRTMKLVGETHPGTVCFVFTDGEPTNKRATEQVIVDIANHISREDEFNITFITVGSIAPATDKWLNGLHDDIEDRLTQDFDIFHVEKLEDVDFVAAVNTVNHD